MNNKDIEAHLNIWLNNYKTLDKICTEFRALFGQCESKMSQTIWMSFDDYTKNLSELIGDKDDWLGWFLWENGAGAKGLHATVNNRKRSVKTIKDLIWLIAAYNNCDINEGQLT